MINVYEELGETSRRQILAELRTGPRNVTEIVSSTGLKQPNVSNHLARMRSKGIVRAIKTGRQVYYSLANPDVEAVVHAVFSIKGGDDADLDLKELAKRYAKSAVNGDEVGCVEVLDSVFRAQVPLLSVYQDLLAPAMALIGTWYNVQAIDEAQEHMASAITERMMARTVHIAGPAKRHGKCCILGCGPQSWHVIGLQMIADYLRLMGWKTLFLGANVPIKAFVNAVQFHQPELVLASANAEEASQGLIDLVAELQSNRSRKNPYLIGVGGLAVNLNPEIYLRNGADFTAPDLKAFARGILPKIELGDRAAILQSVQAETG